jgi:hypothetical protein
MMSKMTREERLAAGWVECFGVWHDNSGWYLGSGRKTYSWIQIPAKGDRRHAFADVEEAKAFAMLQKNQLSYARRFWRRKPKAPPPLKVGDEVMLRAKVNSLDPGTVLEVEVEFTGRNSTWVSSKDIVR